MFKIRYAPREHRGQGRPACEYVFQALEIKDAWAYVSGLNTQGFDAELFLLEFPLGICNAYQVPKSNSHREFLKTQEGTDET